jgi:hypothetical protein
MPINCSSFPALSDDGYVSAGQAELCKNRSGAGLCRFQTSRNGCLQNPYLFLSSRVWGECAMDDKVLSATSPSVPADDHPRPPLITLKELWKQFKADVYGKEVQSAATYSYMWMADQMGHICVGILVNYVFTYLFWKYLWPFLGWDADSYAPAVAGLVAAIVLVGAWELSTYRSSEQAGTGLFPLGRELLRDNAVIATMYMVIGAFVGFGFNLGADFFGLAFLLFCTFVAVWLAPRWLRQKIIWQKAALPYLARLADVERSMGPDVAKALQKLIDDGAPPATKPTQIIIGGPVGSGRTQFAAGIGTEFAFNKIKTRYISVQSLLEFAAATRPAKYPDDYGPINVSYWPWSEAQVIIIDDIGPLIAPQRDQSAAILEHFRNILNQELKPIAGVLAKCHTVWVIGDLYPPGSTVLVGGFLDEFAKAVSEYCQGKQKPLVIELKVPAPAEAADSKPQPTAEARYVETLTSELRSVISEL